MSRKIAGTTSNASSSINPTEDNTMTLKITKLATATALVFSSAILMTAITNAAWADEDHHNAADQVEATDEDTGAEEMSMDDMHAKCMAMHETMKTEMVDGEMPSHAEHSPEMMEMHAECMEARSSMGEMDHKHDHHKPEGEAETESAEPTPHAHDHAPEDGGL